MTGVFGTVVNIITRGGDNYRFAAGASWLCSHGSHLSVWRFDFARPERLACSFVVGLAPLTQSIADWVTAQIVPNGIDTIDHFEPSRAGCIPCSIRGALGLNHELQRHDLIFSSLKTIMTRSISQYVWLGQPSFHRPMHRFLAGHNSQVVARPIASTHLHLSSPRIDRT